jgi:hypothetical protein
MPSIEGEELKQKDKGRPVTYWPKEAKTQFDARVVRGVIHGWSDFQVLVLFPLSEHPHPCAPHYLKWGHL